MNRLSYRPLLLRLTLVIALHTTILWKTLDAFNSTNGLIALLSWGKRDRSLVDGS